jgi:hypothetical protein
MNKTSLQRLINISFISLVIFSKLALADQITIDAAKNYPYKNLIKRTDVVNVFYTTKGGQHKCRVEVALKNMKWASVEKVVNKNVLNDNILSNCLSREQAEKILFQTFIQFGRGL